MSDMDDQNGTTLDITPEDAEQLLDDDAGADFSNDTEQQKPDMGDDLQQEIAKWKSLARKHEGQSKSLSERLKQYEDANKSESQRLQEERDSHKTRAERAEAQLRRLEIAQGVAPEHATFAQLQKVLKRMAGESDDELEADARELWADYAPAPVTPKTATRPKERLRGGGDPAGDDPDDTDDPRKLAARITGSGRS